MNTPGLTIHSQQLKGDELKHFSVKKLEDPDVPAWEKDIYEFILSWLGPSDSIVQHTSGTTGKSKELHLLKSSMTRSAENTCRFFGLGKGQTALLCLPIRYIAGKMMVVRCFIAGTNLEITEPKSMPDLCGAGPVDFCAMVPLQVSNLLENPGAFPPIRKILIGGAEITAALEQMTAKIPGEVYASYGMAETCSHVALRRLNGPGRQSDYHALPEVTLTLDERGCLVINAPFLPHQVITNDLRIVFLRFLNNIRCIRLGVSLSFLFLKFFKRPAFAFFVQRFIELKLVIERNHIASDKE